MMFFQQMPVRNVPKNHFLQLPVSSLQYWESYVIFVLPIIMRRVLIITYYWPPSGGSAVLRWLKFTKYLRDFGWEPVIYTPSNPEPQESDASLLKDIPPDLEMITSRIWEPYNIYKWLTGKKKGDRLGVALMNDKKRAGLLGKVSLWIRSNVFIPDPRRYWVKPSVQLLTRHLRNAPVDVVVSTGPPHSMHLIGLELKERLALPWVADFRDPWTNIDYYQDLPLTRLADRQHKKLEQKVLLRADHVVTVSPGMTREFMDKGIQGVTTITNGYDEEMRTGNRHSTEKFSLLHLGSMPKSRNPEVLWRVLAEMVNNNSQLASRLQVKLIGKTDLAVKDSIVNHHLQDYIVYEDYVPHDQTLDLLSGASVLLLCINNTPNAGGILTNKFFEYLSAQRPVLAIGPVDGDASLILAETGAGNIFDYTDAIGLKNHISALFELYSQHNLTVESRGIEKFSRRNLTRQLSLLLNKLIS
jgi:glycosyltransferase involved in cell wall biosynthesis